MDLATLALATGLGNLAFATLATIYERSAPVPNPDLTRWRWARALGGLALLINGLRLSEAVVALSHVLMFLAWALEFAAFAGHARLTGWPRWLMGLTGLAVAGRFGLLAWGLPRSVDLVYFSLVNGAFFLAMAVVLLAATSRGPLVRMMAASNGLGALIFLARTVWGTWFQPLIPFQPIAINIVMWVVGYLIVIINGFGFLLLTKQADDERLRLALADLVLAEAEQRQLLSLASHEFRTPAAMIQMSLDSLRQLGEEVPPRVERRLTNMRKATQRLTHLANALIAQDRLREMQFALLPRRVDPEALVRTIVDTYATPIPWRGLDRPLQLWADPDLLTIALHNLIDNALRHGPSDDPPVVSLRLDGDRLDLIVADHGPGVPDAEKAAVFERFYRKEGGPGSGLGLSLVRKIARLHGGDITVGDNFPRGAEFVIRLPLNEAGNDLANHPLAHQKRYRHRMALNLRVF